MFAEFKPAPKTSINLVTIVLLYREQVRLVTELGSSKDVIVTFSLLFNYYKDIGPILN